MKRLALIEKLEETFYDVRDIDLETALKILDKKYIKDGFKKIIGDTIIIDPRDVDEITGNVVVKNLLFLYIKLNGLTLSTYEGMSISELDDFFVNYLRDINKNIKLSNEQVEVLLENKTDENKKIITENYLRHVYFKTLEYAIDPFMFEELLQEGNATLICTIDEYDKTKHINFDTLLFFNLNVAMSRKVKEFFSKKVSLNEIELVNDDIEERVTKKVALEEYVKEMLETCNLTNEEKQIIKLRYGLEDGFEHSPIDVASIMNIPRIKEMSIETNAIKKMKILQNDKRRGEILD